MTEDYGISKLKGEFSCKEKEREYSLYYTEKVIYTTKRIILILSLMNFLFLIPDYFAISSRALFIKMVCNRFLYFIGCIIFYAWFDQKENYENYFKGVTLMEFIASSVFLHIYWLYEPANFTIQILGLLLAMAVFVTIHNRLVYVFLINAYSIAGFFAITIIGGKEADITTIISSAVYCIIISGILLFKSYNVNIYKRKRYENNVELRRFSMTDPLTGIANRAAFEKEIVIAVERWRRYGRVFSVAIFDIDDFKKVNDKYGHLEGDRVLVGLASLVDGETREMDILARWGGEEFVVILPETDAYTALGFVERIRSRIRESSFGETKITCSFGVTQIHEGDTTGSIFSRMDEYLYVCKRKGKDMVHHDMLGESLRQA